jgi:uncharacterized RDD family membrane protein YckC
MNESTLLPAPLWRRLLALAYELLAVVAIIMVMVMACLLLTGGKLDPHAWWYRATLLAAVGAYFVISWIRGGQTLGMRPWRLRLRATDGGPVSTQRALLRFAILAAPLLLIALAPLTGTRSAMIAPFAAWIVYLAMAFVDPRHRTVQDLLSGTLLEYRPVPRD